MVKLTLYSVCFTNLTSELQAVLKDIILIIRLLPEFVVKFEFAFNLRLPLI